MGSSTIRGNVVSLGFVTSGVFEAEDTDVSF